MSLILRRRGKQSVRRGFGTRARGVTLWLGLAFLISPIGFNCHSRTDQSINTASTNSERQDDADQTVRAMEVEADGAPKGEEKVRLPASVTLDAAKASQQGLAGKLTSADDSIVPKGQELLALYDNDCRGKKDGVIRFEAEIFQPKEDMSLAKLTADAEADPCLIRLNETHAYELIAPLPDTVTASFAKTAEEISALATVNDPRATEARHIAFSKALAAWDWFYSGAGITNDVVVAVIDTGVLHTHPDLIDNRFQNGNGFNGYDFVNNDNDPTDDNGHGTHVAGIIGARANNAAGVTGVMGTSVKLMGIKVLNAQGSTTSDVPIVNGIRYAADNGAHVINMSLGGTFQSTAIRDAMVYAVQRGVVVIIAAGNDNVLMNAGAQFYTPASYARDIPGLLAVGSVDAVNGSRSTFSNYSTNYVWIAAPGSNGILSTFIGNTYTALQGTSMASPVVAGAAALLVGAYRANSIQYVPNDVTTLLTDSARPVAALNTFFRNGATLDIERAAKLFYSRYVMSSDGATEVQ